MSARSIKAVIFTHVRKDPKDLAKQAGANKFRKEMGTILEGYLRCRNVGIVFVYVSWTVEKLVHAVRSGEKLDIIPLLNEENTCITSLQQALGDAEKKASRDRANPRPIVHFFGVERLAPLLELLQKISPTMLTFLAGRTRFTYDSPKFFEAMIRIVRGVDPVLARHPVVRMDSDVRPDDDAFGRLVSEYDRRIKAHERFFFLSGGYVGRTPDDHLNKHAVRVHWFARSKLRSGRYPVDEGALCFLKDLEAFGGRQDLPPEVEFSHACRNLLAAVPLAAPRSPQVISGAGLIMSIRAILTLPPVMQADHLIVWIDDYLKRRLHESVGDIEPTDTERLGSVYFRQDRGAPEEAPLAEVYLERLLRGCLMHSMIVERQGTPGHLGRFLAEAILGGWTAGPASQIARLESDLTAAARRQLGELLDVWANSKVDYGNDTVATYAGPIARDPAKQAELIRTSVADAIGYTKLFFDWKLYVDSFLRIKRRDAPWLFADLP